ncbi:hypothetical protein [Nocardioides sp.]|uniref:hypothetical protein n=1 Tax=Nocardioides sp. TaxID=35761 RepID=UPI0026366E27|nr:hypothetical protein [Nocardioides sp.]
MEPQSQPSRLGPRGVFFDEDAARTVIARLGAEGWESELSRDHFSGEDDDEDHPWTVTTDAPGLVLEMMVDEFDGWFEDAPSVESSPLPPLPPLDLPAAPKRIKRPDLGSNP